MRPLILLLLLFVVAGCSLGGHNKADERPGWLLNPPQRSGYLYGVGSSVVGSGGTPAAEEVAKGGALAAILQQIEVRTSVDETARVSRTRDNQGNVALTRSIEQVVRQQVPQLELHHLAVVERYLNPKEQRLYLLYQLDIAAEASDLSRRLADLELELSSYKRLLDEVGSDVPSLRRIAPALRLLAERQQIQTQLDRLQPGRTTALGAIEWSELKAAILARFASLTVSIATRDETPAVTAAIANRLAKLGLVVKEGDAALQVVYTVRLSEVAKDDVVFAFAEGTVTMTTADDTTLYSNPVMVKKGATSADLARDRAVQAVANEMGEALINSLLSE